MEVRELAEYKSSLVVEINGKRVILPKFASVNGTLQSEYYEIQNGDAIEFLNYYTVEQILKFMDLPTSTPRSYYVNNAVADMGTRVYENFTFSMEEVKDSDYPQTYSELEELHQEEEKESTPARDEGISALVQKEAEEKEPKEAKPALQKATRQIVVMVNKAPVVLQGKEKYIFVDVFDYISFDLSKPQGAIVTTLNGKQAQFMEELHDGDILEIYWRTI